MNVKKHFIAITVITLAALPLSLYAAAMQSSNYQIIIDSLNTGGGNSVSSNYTQESTVGEIATGESSSANYQVKAGYQQMVSTSISISSPADISLSPINGLLGGSSTGSADWTVTTDNPGGYTLSIQAGASPALQASGGASFADYAPGGTPSFAFTVSSTDSAFGFTPEGTDITSTYKDNGSTCATGSSDAADSCWDGFSTSPKTIATRTTASTPTGALTTVKVKAESGSSHIQDSGAYSSSITVTAVEL